MKKWTMPICLLVPHVEIIIIIKHITKLTNSKSLTHSQSIIVDVIAGIVVADDTLFFFSYLSSPNVSWIIIIIIKYKVSRNLSLVVFVCRLCCRHRLMRVCSIQSQTMDGQNLVKFSKMNSFQFWQVTSDTAFCLLFFISTRPFTNSQNYLHSCALPLSQSQPTTINAFHSNAWTK